MNPLFTNSINRIILFPGSFFMVIVFATDQYWPSISGVSVSVDSFKTALEKKGHTVYIFAPDYPEAGDFDKLKKDPFLVRFNSKSLFFNKKNRLVLRTERRKIYSRLDKIKPDIIHAQTEFNLGKICLRYAQKRKITRVATSHTNWEELVNIYLPFFPQHLARLCTRMYLRSFYKKAEAVIAPTSLMETLLHLYFINKPMYVIPTGIITPDNNKNTTHRKKTDNSMVYYKHPSLKGKSILFYAGRLGMEKNISFLIDVFDRLEKEFNRLVLVIAGDGPDRQRLEEIVNNRKLTGKIIFTGYVNKNDINNYYRAADIFVFASIVESQGLVILESMSCGTPVVAIGKMGTREVMSGDNGGYMVDYDLDEFTEKTRLLLTDSGIHKNKSREAVHHAEKWTINAMADKLIKLYTRLNSEKQNHY